MNIRIVRENTAAINLPATLAPKMGRVKKPVEGAQPKKPIPPDLTCPASPSCQQSLRMTHQRLLT
jgi:hypothetical protein